MSSDNKERILEGSLNVYKAKGVKFTMDDLASELGMSKKTIYTVFPDKGTLLLEMVDYAFDSVSRTQSEALNNPDMSLVDKLKNILGVLPEAYVGVDFTQLYVLKGKYPKAYARLRQRLESGWERTLALIDEGVEQGLLREVNKVVFQLAHEATLERFLMGDELSKNKLSYEDALTELVDIMTEGIIVRN
ncbi:MAG: TetR/AcrR family transcriptional regulator [Lachnospiraceae bacterium]|nr:TetR/AcrR family transcriptional regulator [Lachnospiraceae bacterium]